MPGVFLIKKNVSGSKLAAVYIVERNPIYP